MQNDGMLRSEGEVLHDGSFVLCPVLRILE